MKKFKKLSYYTDAVRTSEKECQEENFILGMVKFFDNFNTFYYLTELIEKECNVELSALPSFNNNSEDDLVSNFRMLRVKTDKSIINNIKENFSTIQYKNSSISFNFFLEDSTDKMNIIQIEMV